MSTAAFTSRFAFDFLLCSRRRAADKSNHSNRKRRLRHCACSYHFVVAVWSAKAAESALVKYWEAIADNLKKRGWSYGYSEARPGRWGMPLPFPRQPAK
jgi:hypothetical protein